MLFAQIEPAMDGQQHLSYRSVSEKENTSQPN